MSVRKLCEIVSLLLNWAFLLQSRLVACPSSTISHLCNQFVLGIYSALQETVCVLQLPKAAERDLNCV